MSIKVEVGFYRILSTIHKLYQVSPDWIFLFMLLHKVETTIKPCTTCPSYKASDTLSGLVPTSCTTHPLKWASIYTLSTNFSSRNT